MKYNLFKLIMLMVSCLTAINLYAETYVNNNSKYELTYNTDWNRVYPRQNFGDLILICNGDKCAPRERAFINSKYIAEYSDFTTSQFLNKLNQDDLVSMIRQMVQDSVPGSSVSFLQLPQRKKIGNIEGYISKIAISYPDGRTRNMIYGLTYYAGWEYHLEVFADSYADARLQKTAIKLFAGFLVKM